MNTNHSQEKTTEMESCLDSMKITLSPSGQKILSALKEPLINASHTSDQGASSIAIANRIDQDYPWTGSTEDAEIYLWNLWFVIIGIVRRIPIDHPMQDVLVGALNDLRQRRRDGQGENHTFYGSKVWEDLPILSMAMKDFWSSPIDIDNYEVSRTPNDAVRWRGMNTFAARLTASGYLLFSFFIWQVRTGLEKPLPPPAAEAAQLIIETRLQIASDWILRCAAVMFPKLTTEGAGDDFDEDDHRAFRPGELCEKGMATLSRRRWDFWRERLREMLSIGSEEGSIRLDEGVRRQIEKAIETMKKVEEG